MISGFKQVTITSGATDLVFTKIDPGRSEYRKETVTVKGVSGDLIRVQDEAILMITVFDNENFYVLEGWMRNHTNITEVEVEGIGEHIYWKAATTILVKKNYGLRSGSLNSFTILMHQVGNDLSSDIYATNILEEE